MISTQPTIAKTILEKNKMLYHSKKQALGWITTEDDLQPLIHSKRAGGESSYTAYGTKSRTS